MEKQKYYTVWIGRKIDVYHSWEECKTQTDGFPDAKYKSFNTLKEAEEA